MPMPQHAALRAWSRFGKGLGHEEPSVRKPVTVSPPDRATADGEPPMKSIDIHTLNTEPWWSQS